MENLKEAFLMVESASGLYHIGGGETTRKKFICEAAEMLHDEIKQKELDQRQVVALYVEYLVSSSQRMDSEVGFERMGKEVVRPTGDGPLKELRCALRFLARECNEEELTKIIKDSGLRVERTYDWGAGGFFYNLIIPHRRSKVIMLLCVEEKTTTVREILKE